MSDNSKWKPIAEIYNPLTAGSIDGTDTIPHDRAVSHAMFAYFSPPKGIKSSPRYVIFVGSLPLDINKNDLERKFSYCGKIKSIKIIKDILTGFCKGYAFIEFSRESEAAKAYKLMDGVEFKGKKAIVDYEVGRTMAGWIPRRLGGGWGGRKESGQLRFGCRERPFRKPINMLNVKKDCSKSWFEDSSSSKYTMSYKQE